MTATMEAPDTEKPSMDEVCKDPAIRKMMETFHQHVTSGAEENAVIAAKTTNETDKADSWKLASTHGVDPRSALGQQFMRDPEGGKSAGYREMTRGEKEAFRKTYAGMKHFQFSAERSDTSGFTEVDKSKGTYRSIPWLVREEGLEAVEMILPKIAKLGGKWLQ